MRSYAGVVLMVISLLLAVTAALMIYNTNQEISQEQITVPNGEPEITGVRIEDVNNQKAKTIELEIRGGEQAVKVEDTLITIQTQQATTNYKLD